MKNRLRNINLSAEIWNNYTANLGHEDSDELLQKLRNFTKDKPCVLECCCGKGEFLKEEAKKYPEKQFIGVDYSFPVLQRAVKRASEAELKNVLFIHNSIEDLFGLFRKATSFERIYVNFSDPWPKKRHWKRRVIQKDTLSEIHKLMNKETLLFVVTDHEGYRDWIEKIFISSEDLFIPEFHEWYITEMDEFHESDYMNKGKAKGYRINYFVARKKI